MRIALVTGASSGLGASFALTGQPHGVCSLYARNHVHPPSDFLQVGSTGNPSVYMGNHAKSMSGQPGKLFTFRFNEGSRLLYCANKCE